MWGVLTNRVSGREKVGRTISALILPQAKTARQDNPQARVVPGSIEPPSWVRAPEFSEPLFFRRWRRGLESCPYLTDRLSELHLRALGEGEAAPRLHVLHAPARRADDPLLPRQVFQPADARARRVFGNGGDRPGEVVHLLLVDVVREEARVEVEHDDRLADAYARREPERGGAGPAEAGVAAARPEGLPVVEVFERTVRAVEDRVAQGHHRAAPLALAHAAVEGVAHPFGEGAREEVAQGLRVEPPEGERVVVDAGHGRVRVVTRVEDEERLGAVEFGHRGEVETFYLGLLP